MSSSQVVQEYSDFHRTFVQYFLAKNTMEKNDLINNFYKLLLQQYNVNFSLENTVDTVNKEILSFGLKIICIRCNKGVYFCLVNHTNDKISKCACIYEEKHFKVLECFVNILKTMDTAVLDEDILEELTHRLTFTHTIPQLYDQLKKDKWITVYVDGTVDLGARAYVELQEWLESMDIPVCELCRDLALTGFNCTNDECHCRLHTLCVNEYLKVHNASCPKCKSQWSTVPSASSRVSSSLATSRLSNTRSSISRNSDVNSRTLSNTSLLSTSITPNSISEMSEDEDLSINKTPTRRLTRPSKRRINQDPDETNSPINENIQNENIQNENTQINTNMNIDSEDSDSINISNNKRTTLPSSKRRVSKLY